MRTAAYRRAHVGQAALRLALASALVALSFSVLVREPAHAQLSSNATIITTGLNSPRGLVFGPERQLYVAEAGLGGSQSTIGLCDQVPAPVGPYTGGFTARILSIGRNGMATVVASGLPSTMGNPKSGGNKNGVADLAFLEGRLYALITGAGCSHGLPGTVNGVYQVNHNGSLTLVADLSTFVQTHPVLNPEPDDFEPDGDFYSMVAVRGNLYAVEANHGEVDRISPSGRITRVVDISATQGHVVPTSIVYKGSFFVGNLGTFPMAQGGEVIYRLNPAGHLTVAASGLTAVLGVAADRQGRLYALESFTGFPFPAPPAANSGRIVRIDPNGAQTVVASGFNFPTAMRFGPDGALYVSNNGYNAPPGAGQIVRVVVPGVSGEDVGGEE